MRKIKLTKVKYLGKGYFHCFRNDTTNEIVREECTEPEYKRMGEKGGSKYNPVREGLTWLHSEGGAIRVDSPKLILGNNEYCDFNNKKAVIVEGEFMVVPPEEIDAEDQITVTN